jgi:beta-lactamase superfamily II metal-dependent hydrolase
MVTMILDEPLARVWYKPTGGSVFFMHYWGDDVLVESPEEAEDPSIKAVEIKVRNPYEDDEAGGVRAFRTGYIRKRRVEGSRPAAYQPIAWREPGDYLLELTFIDVQQGDATLIRTPARRTLLIDGGEGSFVARMLAQGYYYPDTTAADPLQIDALVISHGDADHFTGLKELDEARHHGCHTKRIHTAVRRCFHNGLVKGPAKVDGRRVSETLRFGARQKIGKRYYATQLWDDPRNASFRNGPFERWAAALTSLQAGATDDGQADGVPLVHRLQYGDDAAFDFLRDEAIDVRVLGPVTEMVDGSVALPILRDEEGSSRASHTINGHSVILRMKYDRVGVLMGGDLNIDGAHRLLENLVEHDEIGTLRSEILKVPHHGSHEFDRAFLAAVSPVISVVSSGDENAMKEYVHPRANLMAALGQCARPDAEALVFSTELAAFFRYERRVVREDDVDKYVAYRAGADDGPCYERNPAFYGFSRVRFGRVRIRTDGRRIVAATESASDGIKEAYTIDVSATGAVATAKARTL